MDDRLRQDLNHSFDISYGTALTHLANLVTSEGLKTRGEGVHARLDPYNETRDRRGYILSEPCSDINVNLDVIINN